MHDRSVILNVDDNDGARHAKTRVLLNAGFRVEEAADGTSALEMVSQLVPTLVLLDIKLPDMHGTSVCRQIKADPATRNVMVLAISAALISPSDKQRALSSGADAFVAVPFEPAELVRTVRELVRNQENLAGGASVPEQ